ncbi:MAG TPA: hypothetical protein VF104_08235 [Burkholderiales bacterium]
MVAFPYLHQVFIGVCLVCGSNFADALALDLLADLGAIPVAIQALAAVLFLAPVHGPGGMLQEACAASRVAAGRRPVARALSGRLRIPMIFSPRNPARTKTAARF